MGNRAKHLCVVGLQWGDEGKGKLVDVLTSEFDVVVRYQGGANAGHTVQIADKQYILHLIPSGILQEGKACVIGNGVVLDPKTFVDELDALRASGIDREENIWISDRAHVVLPYHRLLDAAREEGPTNDRIGTTLRGIGPCYADKAARIGLRTMDLVNPDRFRELLTRNLEAKNEELVKLHGREPLDVDEVYEEYRAYGERLRPRLCDISRLLRARAAAGENILFEGAQGFLLDLDLGTYPFVTSSNTSFLGLGAGTGFSQRRIATVLGVVKAYSTRVGEGPFPTELDPDAAEELRNSGGEFGATTGRPRRCGWLDLVALRYAVEFGDIDALAVTKLDVLSDFDEIRVATRYVVDGRETRDFPYGPVESIVPLYETVPGWRRDISGARSPDDLPSETIDYLRFIARESGCPVAMASVGKERSAIIRFEDWLRPALDSPR